MAKIIRNGKTPIWGVYQGDKQYLEHRDGFILDSYNYSVNIKEFEQLNESGQVVGHVTYDQTIDFDMSGTLLYGCSAGGYGSDYAQSVEASELGTARTPIRVAEQFMPAFAATFGGFSCGMEVPAKAIVKNVSVNTSQGNAVTFSASGTIYSF